MVENQSKNLIPIAIIVAALIVAGAIVWATMIYVKGIEKPSGILEETGPAAVIQPEISEEPQVEGEPSLEALAKCLSQKGAKFYGVAGCGWCQKQKEMFGQAAKYLPYVECTEKRAECEAANVGPIPDWRFPDGRQELGLQSLEQLAELSGCQL